MKNTCLNQLNKSLKMLKDINISPFQGLYVICNYSIIITSLRDFKAAGICFAQKRKTSKIHRNFQTV